MFILSVVYYNIFYWLYITKVVYYKNKNTVLYYKKNKKIFFLLLTYIDKCDNIITEREGKQMTILEKLAIALDNDDYATIRLLLDIMEKEDSKND